MKAALLMTCHNRKDKTLQCLRSVPGPEKLRGNLLDVFLVDDGSTDGTCEAVGREFPNVEVLQGNGQLYWNGGMNVAWAAAAVSDYDAYVWINDDVHLRPDAFEILFDAYQATTKKHSCGAVIVGSFTEKESGDHAYGGFLVSRSWLSLTTRRVIPQEALVPCDTFNGNLVLIPRDVFKSVGYLDERYTHSFGDKDYGYNCMRRGIPMYVAPGYLGSCSRNSVAGSWHDPALGIGERYRRMKLPTGLPPNEYFYSYKKNGGAATALLAVIKLYLRLLVPGLWSKHSRSKSGE